MLYRAFTKRKIVKRIFVRPFVPIIRLRKVNREFSLTELVVNMAAYTREQRMLFGEGVFNPNPANVEKMVSS